MTQHPTSATPSDDTPLVRSSVDRAVATITLDSPRNRNALSARLRAGLFEALGAAMDDDEVRAVVLTGTGPIFSAGADLKEVGAALRGEPVEPAPELPEIFERIMAGPKPVVALLNGPARAGGIGLVAAADIALAPAEATFAFTEVRIGVVPAIISLPLSARMHPRQFSRYLLTGEVFDAEAAVEAGLLTRAVPEGEMEEELENVLQGMRAAAPKALARTKELIGELAGGERILPERRADEFARLGELSAGFFAGEDAVEGRTAFFEKRPPRWSR
ncbi:enoyl-CoA hydratase-related protein [Nocardiopsis sp. LDBS1602]|uniref:enoyl-CoA hydratase-related protein n=1 Tax=Nocardiopsis sp. LDBS1602 TaxID=3109597 RepID=UPI002DBF5AE5|nr:enoyl-CoA hydratase-related protein [Nocardiopsis sp. LDBS1602]MEC3893881.1 enoyl-CoA hydratase-related protein [Nocardiopsis sp. LDBS1602]